MSKNFVNATKNTISATALAAGLTIMGAVASNDVNAQTKPATENKVENLKLNEIANILTTLKAEGKLSASLSKIVIKRDSKGDVTGFEDEKGNKINASGIRESLKVSGGLKEYETISIRNPKWDERKNKNDDNYKNATKEQRAKMDEDWNNLPKSVRDSIINSVPKTVEQKKPAGDKGKSDSSAQTNTIILEKTVRDTIPVPRTDTVEKKVPVIVEKKIKPLFYALVGPVYSKTWGKKYDPNAPALNIVTERYDLDGKGVIGAEAGVGIKFGNLHQFDGGLIIQKFPGNDTELFLTNAENDSEVLLAKFNTKALRDKWMLHLLYQPRVVYHNGKWTQGPDVKGKFAASAAIGGGVNFYPKIDLTHLNGPPISAATSQTGDARVVPNMQFRAEIEALLNKKQTLSVYGSLRLMYEFKKHSLDQQHTGSGVHVNNLLSNGSVGVKYYMQFGKH